MSGKFNNVFFLSVLILSKSLMAQDPKHDHQHNHNSHQHPKNEIDINNFHIGPALEVATSFEEYHSSIGLHMAIAF